MKSCKVLIPLLALTASLAAPLAFAQSSTAGQQAEQAPPAADQAATQAPPAASATQSKKTWADVDGDKDGNISKTEAATEPAVGDIFDKADANKDGSLTPTEYKSFVAKNNGASKKDSQGGAD